MKIVFNETKSYQRKLWHRRPADDALLKSESSRLARFDREFSDSSNGLVLESRRFKPKTDQHAFANIHVKE